MRYCFGPVPSRRLGLSLGLDILPDKTCNFNCIYCELGRSERLTCKRGEYCPTHEILAELDKVFTTGEIAFDCITVTASGEPCLHSQLGKILAFAKERSTRPVVLLTNSSLFNDPQVRAEARQADLVLPSLDAARERAFRRVNRPARQLVLEDIIDGLCRFREEFSGRLWLEVLLVAGVNDTNEDIGLLKKAIEKIGPDRIQLNTVDRPPAEDWARPVSIERLRTVAGMLGGPTEIIAKFKRKDSCADLPLLEREILRTLKRRPLSHRDIEELLGNKAYRIEAALKAMIDSGVVDLVRVKGTVFYHLNNPQ